MNQELRIIVKADGTVQVTGQLDKMNNSIKSTEASSKSMNATMMGIAKSLLPIMSVMGAVNLLRNTVNKTIEVAREQVKAERMLESQLRATGNAVRLTSKEIWDMASNLQKLTNIGDEGIVKNLVIPLTTFKSISGDVFKSATKAIMDLNAVFGDASNPESLRSTAIQVGKALNDPLTGLLALRRAGVSFTAAQKEMIQSLVESGKLVEAQNMILKELEDQFGGAAEAAVNTGTQLKNAFGDYLEVIGKRMLPALDGVNLAFANLFSALASNHASALKDMESKQRKHFKAWNEFATAFALNAVTMAIMVAESFDLIDKAARLPSRAREQVEDWVSRLKSSVFGGEMSLYDAAKSIGQDLANNVTGAKGAFNFGKELNDIINPIKEYGKLYQNITQSSLEFYDKKAAINKQSILAGVLDDDETIQSLGIDVDKDQAQREKLLADLAEFDYRRMAGITSAYDIEGRELEQKYGEQLLLVGNNEQAIELLKEYYLAQYDALTDKYHKSFIDKELEKVKIQKQALHDGMQAHVAYTEAIYGQSINLIDAQVALYEMEAQKYLEMGLTKTQIDEMVDTYRAGLEDDLHNHKLELWNKEHEFQIGMINSFVNSWASAFTDVLRIQTQSQSIAVKAMTNFVNQMISELIRLIAKQIIAAILAKALLGGASGGGLGFWGLIGSLFTKGTSGGMPSIPAQINNGNTQLLRAINNLSNRIDQQDQIIRVFVDPRDISRAAEFGGLQRVYA